MRSFRSAERACCCLLLALLPAAAALAAAAQLPPASIPAAAPAAGPPSANSSSSPRRPGPPVSPSPLPPPAGNHSGGAQLSPVAALLRDLPALKAAVIGICAASACLFACLLFRVLRSGRRTKKTRKYDIITTPAERVEMAPLNEEEEEEEDTTVFDIKYR